MSGVIQSLTSSIMEHRVTVSWLLLLPIYVVLVSVFAYLKDGPGLRAYPGPLLAKFSDLWVFWAVRRNCLSKTVDALHRKYGPFVRISPNHISISDPRALHIIYGHSAGFTKAEFYDIFTTQNIPNIFSARSRVVHSRKRRMEAHIFSEQSIRTLEPLCGWHIAELLRQWDYLASRVHATQDGALDRGQLGSTSWCVQDGRVWFDSIPWFTFWAFDTIGDLAFGRPFGMLKSGKDTAKVARSPKDVMKAIADMSVGLNNLLAIEEEEIPYIEILTTRAETNLCLAWFSARWQAVLKRMPPFRKHPVASAKLGALASLTVARRIADPNPRRDMLQKLLEARDEEGRPLSPAELSTEAFVFIVAGSDTIANTSGATMYYLARDQRVQAKLQAELDKALVSVDSDVAPYEIVKDLPYLDAVVREAQRLHSTIGVGLPRTVPRGGATIAGQYFKEGTWVSVPLYHVHRDEAIWGPDAADFRPERWIEASTERKKQMTEAFAPFSIGPRACIARSLALMQLHVIFATLSRRYDIVLQSNAPLEIRDSFARSPRGCTVGLRRRDI